MWRSGAGGVGSLLEALPQLTRGDVLVACWFEARHGSPEWCGRWSGWATRAGQVMWWGEVDYDTIPDPPGEREEQDV